MFPSGLTASEPNLLKVRLKQRVIERRASPMARRQDRLLKHRSPSKLAHHHSVALRTVASMHSYHFLFQFYMNLFHENTTHIIYILIVIFIDYIIILQFKTKQNACIKL